MSQGAPLGKACSLALLCPSASSGLRGAGWGGAQECKRGCFLRLVGGPAPRCGPRFPHFGGMGACRLSFGGRDGGWQVPEWSWGGPTQTTQATEGLRASRPAKAWLSLGMSPAPGSAPARPQPGHLISLALGLSTGPHLPLAPPSRWSWPREAGQPGRFPGDAQQGSRAGPRPALAGLWSAGPALLPTPKAGGGSGRCRLCSGPGASLWVCFPIHFVGTGEVPAAGPL